VPRGERLRVLIALQGIEPAVPMVQLKHPAPIVQTSLRGITQTPRKGATMSNLRETWLCILHFRPAHRAATACPGEYASPVARSLRSSSPQLVPRKLKFQVKARRDAANVSAESVTA
jgi:hypothetical protein